MKADKINPVELIFNWEFYPRHAIDGANVTDLIDVMDAGIELPPVIAWRKNKWIIDGFHRTTAALRKKMPFITVEWHDYPNEAAALEDAIRRTGGPLRLAKYDKARCLILAEKFHLSRGRLALALGLTEERLASLEARKIASGPDSGLMPIKLTAQHLAGQQLTDKQVLGNAKATGLRGIVYINQVVNLIDNDLIDRSDADTMKALRGLHKLLGRLFARNRAGVK